MSLGAPLLTLPELVELPVAEELHVAAIGRIGERGIPGREEALVARDIGEAGRAWRARAGAGLHREPAYRRNWLVSQQRTRLQHPLSGLDER